MLSGCKYRMCRKVRVKRMSIFLKILLIFLLFLPESYFIKNELLHYSDWWADPAKQNIPAAMHHFRNIGYFSLIPGMIDVGIIVEFCIVRIGLLCKGLFY